MEATKQSNVRFYEPILVGIVAGVLSVWRLVASNELALRELLWAEDGLFPLCVVKEDLFTCLTDPFAGYLLFAPRALAGIVAAFPMADWPFVANTVAAALAGATAAFSFWIVRRSGAAYVTAVFLGLLPVLAPIVGLEAINTVGSVYMLLLYVMTLAIAFPVAGRAPVAWMSIGALITALTIPTAAMLFIALAVQGLRRAMRIRDVLIIGGALALGLVLQFAVAFGAPDRRNMTVTWWGLNDWTKNMPNAVLSYWPGMNFGDSETIIFGQFPLTPFALTGWVLAVGILLLGLWLVIAPRTSRVGVGSGILLLTGLAYGAIPTLTGYGSNRYYVVPVLLWAAAAIMLLDERVHTRRELKLGVVYVLLLALWLPAFGASVWRGGPTPLWSSVIEGIRGTCADPGAVVDVVFTPDWPTPLVALTPPTDAKVLCFTLVSGS
jgi:hypothetical protein